MPTENTAPSQKGKPKKKKKRNAWLSLLIKVAIIAAVFFGASFVIKIRFVHTNEMFPSLRDGDLVIATNLLSYSFNDVVAYQTTGSNGKKTTHFGRIICLSENEVEIDDYGNTLVNGSIVTTNNFYLEYDKGTIKYPYQIPKDSFFILQDYRPVTTDSRTFGAISKKDILGKVIFTFRIRNF